MRRQSNTPGGAGQSLGPWGSGPAWKPAYHTRDIAEGVSPAAKVGLPAQIQTLRCSDDRRTRPLPVDKRRSQLALPCAEGRPT